MRIIGIDPGKVSGVVLILDGEILNEGETTSLRGIYTSLDSFSPDVIVIENFIAGFRWRGRDAESPIKIIGVCELYAEMQDREITIFRSNPSCLQGKVRPRGMSPHIFSARVHALSYLERISK